MSAVHTHRETTDLSGGEDPQSSLSTSGHTRASWSTTLITWWGEVVMTTVRFTVLPVLHLCQEEDGVQSGDVWQRLLREGEGERQALAVQAAATSVQ